MKVTEAPKSSTLATGFAMFSMFFGAGNIAFPLAIGKYAESQNFYAILGLLLTAVFVPLLGLISMTLFNGNSRHFFERIGSLPGFLITLLIMGLIGPFGGLPRLIVLSHATFTQYWSAIPLNYFSAISCLIIFIMSFQKGRIVDIIGYLLTPFLLLSLCIIIILGFLDAPSAQISSLPPLDVFRGGFLRGYQTMDLLASFFFSAVVLSCLEPPKQEGKRTNFRGYVFMTLKASVIAAGLLAFIYVGFSYLSAFNSSELTNVPDADLLGVLALKTLGPYAGIVVIIAVTLACLTTAIALVAVFSEFLHNDILMKKVGYLPCLIGTIAITFYFSMFEFEGIAAFLAPVLELCYPALIVLTVMNILHKLYHINIVKTPVIATLVITVLAQLIG